MDFFDLIWSKYSIISSRELDEHKVDDDQCGNLWNCCDYILIRYWFDFFWSYFNFDYILYLTENWGNFSKQYL